MRYQSTAVSKKLLAAGKGVLTLLAIVAVLSWLVAVEVAPHNASAIATRTSQ
jgi:hypothetical protein